MERDAFQRVRELFHELAELDETEQRAALDALDEPAEVRAELAALLGHRPALSAFDEDHLGEEGLRLVVDSATDGGAAEPLDGAVELPERIAGYRVEALLGRGGMGTVYRCVQDSPRREVAIKVLHSLAAQPDRLRRFHYEAEVLASLNHPFVTQVHQSGIDPALGGLPYLVMELVDGRDLLAHCDALELGLEERLKLFACVCEGVEHAHRHGIVHRDLKPANILVGADGRPRILDFGLARPSRPGDDTTPGDTRTGSVLGSLAWMSPEQASGRVAEIDTRSDVYSLGLILYKLLAGRLPYEVEGLAPWEAARVIHSVEPKRLGRVRRGVASDLEAICAMALEKEPARRYPSAGALGRDVERFLALRPVEARGNSVAYQLRKFARRHRAAVATSLLVLAALIVGVIVSTTGFVLARAELERSNEVSRFLREVLSSVRPEIARSADTELMRRVLDHAATRLDAGEVRDPGTEAELREVIGGTFFQLGEPDEALRHYGRSLELLRSSGGAGGPVEARALGGLARVHERDHDLETAERIARAALVLPELGSEERSELETTLAVICARTGRHAEALALATRVVEEVRARHPGDPLTPLVQQNLLAFVAERAGRLEEAEALAREVLATADRHGFERDEGVRLTALRTLYEVERQSGRLEDALATALECQELQRPVYGARALWTSLGRTTVVELLTQLGRGDEALALVMKALDAQREEGGPPELELLVQAIGLFGSGLGTHATVQRVIGELEAFLDEGGDDPAETYQAELLLARVWLVAGRRADAMTLLERLVPEGRESLGAAHAEVLHATNTLAVERTVEGRLDEAFALLEGALDACAELEEPPLICSICRHSLAEALLAAGQLEPAVEELELALDDYLERDEAYAELAFAQLHDALMRLGRPERAAEVFARRLEWLAKHAEAEQAPPSALLALAEALLDGQHPELRDPARALALAERAVERAPAIDVRAEITRARSLAQTGGKALALEQLDQALLALPEDAPPESFEALERAIDELAH